MATEAGHTGYSIELKGFPSGKVIEYELMEDYSGFKNFKPIGNRDHIPIKKNDNVLVIRYKCADPGAEVPDGFEIKPVTGKVTLIPHQFSTRKDEKGVLWSYCVFQVITMLYKSNIDLNSTTDVTDHDSDMEPPEPPIP